MSIFSPFKTAITLLAQGKWHEFHLRALIALGRIDLKTVTVDELNLSPKRAYSYSDSGREDLQKVLAALEIRKGDAVVDFGCGKGGALITFAAYDFSRITGVEISGELAAVARKNLESLKIKNVEVICCDATEFLELDDYNYFYFYNPFPCPVMIEVIENIGRSLTRRPRKVTLVYLNPWCHEQIIAHGIFQKIDEFEHCSHKFLIYSNSTLPKQQIVSSTPEPRKF